MSLRGEASSGCDAGFSLMGDDDEDKDDEDEDGSLAVDEAVVSRVAVFEENFAFESEEI